MVNFYWNRMRYVNIINTLHDGLIQMMSSQDEQAKLIIASEMRYMKRLTKAFWICALITGNLMCFHSAIQSFFYSPVIEFDVSEVNWYYLSMIFCNNQHRLTYRNWTEPHFHQSFFAVGFHLLTIGNIFGSFMAFNIILWTSECWLFLVGIPLLFPSWFSLLLDWSFWVWSFAKWKKILQVEVFRILNWLNV